MPFGGNGNLVANGDRLSASEVFDAVDGVEQLPFGCKQTAGGEDFASHISGVFHLHPSERAVSLAIALDYAGRGQTAVTM